jgi:hypothetical protein
VRKELNVCVFFKLTLLGIKGLHVLNCEVMILPEGIVQQAVSRAAVLWYLQAEAVAFRTRGTHKKCK